jgi:hypothetical protein
MTQLSTYRGKRLLDDATTGTQMPPRVSINGNKFALIDPSGSVVEVPFLPDGPALDVVFVDGNEHISKLFWGLDKPYNPGETSPPLCFSDNGVAPSSAAQEPQSATCAACPHNIIGSAISQISGARIKACGDLKKFAVVAKGFQGAYLLTIKPGSFKAWNNYTNWLQLQKLADGGRPDLSDVVTRIRFSGQGIHSFEAIELVADGSELAQQVISIWENNKTNDITGLMIGRFDQPLAGGALPTPQQAAMPQQAAPPPPQPALFQQVQPPLASVPTPAAPKPRGRPVTKKDERAPIAPAAPTQHGMQTPQSGTPSTDISARLDNLFKLPNVK